MPPSSYLPSYEKEKKQSQSVILPEFWMCIEGTKHLPASRLERERIVVIENSTPCLIKRPFILNLKNEQNAKNSEMKVTKAFPWMEIWILIG